jgi:hypothetical protein
VWQERHFDDAQHRQMSRFEDARYQTLVGHCVGDLQLHVEGLETVPARLLLVT